MYNCVAVYNPGSKSTVFDPIYISIWDGHFLRGVELSVGDMSTN